MRWEENGYVYDNNNRPVGFNGQPVGFAKRNYRSNNNDSGSPIGMFILILLFIVIYGVHKDYFSIPKESHSKDSIVQTNNHKNHHSTKRANPLK
jgi:hypothetical protein